MLSEVGGALSGVGVCGVVAQTWYRPVGGKTGLGLVMSVPLAATRQVQTTGPCALMGAHWSGSALRWSELPSLNGPSREHKEVRNRSDSRNRLVRRVVLPARLTLCYPVAEGPLGLVHLEQFVATSNVAPDRVVYLRYR